ncbi:hypothetical protein K491DRAFT_614512 [Lophiostoma macrostomum CBS 122681]|uniref:RING-type E3 ubiquitin transferase n=1 Tax=Lophiostoma macrostomum CBS 122681 TaxID=1314788 RepID=A0A6A6SI60_9PLEO|nr:hypothetical protein K491DRAFT_614512 [Lophiostoma macrostomum CBS 122681]
MASVNEAPGANTNNPPDPTSPRRGGGRGTGGARRYNEDGSANTFRGRGRGGSRGRGWGNRGEHHTNRNPGKAPVIAAETGTSSENLRRCPSVNSWPSKKQNDSDESDGEVCFICASPVQYTCVARCNHRTCHICSLRLRALYKSKSCAHCRTESDYVIFTNDATKNYDDFSASDYHMTLNNLGIHFEAEEIFADTRAILRFNCPDSECDIACLGWPDLHRHVQYKHGKKMCDLCTRNKKVFTHEHVLFTPADLKKHKRFGDDNPGAIDQTGFKGHPECGFCTQRFYGDDELYTHCRDKHERCHICDRHNDGRQQQYFADYNALELHFRQDHFLCPDQECLDKKFVVFESEMDLKAHQISTHPQGLSKDALRDARRVDMSAFQYRASHEQETGNMRGGGRDGRGRGREGGRGRGRDPNAEPLPPSSAQPMSRAELAYQRQMAIQGSQPGSGRAFGGQLTSAPTPTEAFAARPPPSASQPSTITAPRPPASAPSAAPENAAPEAQPTTTAPRTPQEQARLLRHNAVVERASNLLRNDQPKLAEFRSHIAAYRTSKISATQLIDDFFSLFDTSSAELGKVIKELADIFEIPAKKDTLLKAWNDWKAINEDYPSLPGAAAGLSLGSSISGHGGSRVLKLKKATAQSSQSAVSRQASWSTANHAFPPLSAGPRIGAKPGQTPWASSSSASTPRMSPQPSRAGSSAALNKPKNTSLADAFPALPTAPKPTSTIFSPGYLGAGLRRDQSGRSTPSNNAWGAGGGVGASNNADGVAAEEANGGGAGRKKGNKNKKQTLFHFG